MDRLRISENKGNIHKINSCVKKLFALCFALCFVFLISCSKQAVSQNEATQSAFTQLDGSEIKTQALEKNTSSKQTSDNEGVSEESTALKQDKTTEDSTKDNEKTSSLSAKKDSDKTQKTAKAPSVKTTSKTTVGTTPKTSAKSTTAASPKYTKFCTVSIECKTVLSEKSFNKLDSSKKAVIPSDGVILKKTKVGFTDGENVYDVFKRVCQNNVCSHSCRYCQGRIQFESVPSNFGTYIRGIHYLYEKDCGTSSGWMYRVNGVFPDHSVDMQKVEENDVIEFLYTCTRDDL